MQAHARRNLLTHPDRDVEIALRFGQTLAAHGLGDANLLFGGDLGLLIGLRIGLGGLVGLVGLRPGLGGRALCVVGRSGPTGIGRRRRAVVLLRRGSLLRRIMGRLILVALVVVGRSARAVVRLTGFGCLGLGG